MRKTIITLIFLSSVSLVMAQQKESCPCCFVQARQFDFWIGDWKTYRPDGKLAGTNHITMMQDSCLIQENWTSANNGYTGTSYNFFNTGTKKWQQVWVDNKGGVLQLEGEFKDGRMILSSKELPNSKGEPQIDKITWIPNSDGTVRQLWEVSTDKGKTWSAIFDGLYKKAQ